MQCPACKEISLVMTERQGIEVDYCPQCRGVWLDRGELDKIIERTTSIHGEVSGEYREPQYGWYKRKKHKKRSFLGDLFDFD